MTQGRGWYTIDHARYEQAPAEVAIKVMLPAALADIVHDGDLLLAMGAGDIGQLAPRLLRDGFGASPA